MTRAPSAHTDLPDGGTIPHHEIDQRLRQLDKLHQLAPVAVTGARDDPEAALANLLAALQTLGLIADSTTAS